MIDINEVRKILPHRYPFLLIDRIVALDPKPAASSWVGRKIVALKNVTVNEPFFNGHFPHFPIMPGVLIVEAMAQACAVCAYRPAHEGIEMEVLIAGIDNARFRRPVGPGDQLMLKIELKKDRGSILGFHCEAFVDDQLAAEADILAKTYPRKR